MPVEIKELIIRATVGNPAPAQEQQGSLPGDLKKMKQKLVDEITEEVMKRITYKSER